MIDDCPPDDFEDWTNLMFGAFLGYVNVVKELIQNVGRMLLLLMIMRRNDALTQPIMTSTLKSVASERC